MISAVNKFQILNGAMILIIIVLIFAVYNVLTDDPVSNVIRDGSRKSPGDSETDSTEKFPGRINGANTGVYDTTIARNLFHPDRKEFIKPTQDKKSKATPTPKPPGELKLPGGFALLGTIITGKSKKALIRYNGVEKSRRFPFFSEGDRIVDFYLKKISKNSIILAHGTTEEEVFLRKFGVRKGGSRGKVAGGRGGGGKQSLKAAERREKRKAEALEKREEAKKRRGDRKSKDRSKARFPFEHKSSNYQGSDENEKEAVEDLFEAFRKAAEDGKSRFPFPFKEGGEGKGSSKDLSDLFEKFKQAQEEYENSEDED